MSDQNRYGRIVTPGMVERAVIGTLNRWLDDSLGEVERLEGYAPDAIQRPLGIITVSEFEKWPEDQIPVVIVVNAGLHGPPERHGQTYTASWQLGIAAVVSDTDEVATRQLSLAYVTALRLAMLQHGKLKSDAHPDGFAAFTEWVDEAYNDIPFLSSRNLAAGRLVIEVGVSNVLTRLGPTEPYVPARTDPGAWPAAVEPVANVVPLNATETVS